MYEDIIIVGRGSHAKSIVQIIEDANKYRILGFTVAAEDDVNGEYLGYPILGRDDVLVGYFEKRIKNLAIGIGGFKDNSLRKKIFEKYCRFNFPKIIHPSANIAKNVTIQEGSVVFPGVILNTGVKIGKNVILATKCSVDHETEIKDHVLLSAGVTVGGGSVIHSEVLCALGCSIISGVEVGAEILVGAGAVVVKSLNEKGIYIGVPAKMV